MQAPVPPGIAVEHPPASYRVGAASYPPLEAAPLFVLRLVARILPRVLPR